MHELSIAQSIVEGAVEEAERYSGRVAAVRLQVGQLSGVVKEALLFSYDLACEGTRLEGSRLDIEEIAAAVYCQQCEAERMLETIQHFRCPICLTPTPDVIRGRDLLIVGLEMEDDQTAAG